MNKYRIKEKKELVEKFGREMIDRGFSLGDIIETAEKIIEKANHSINNDKPFDLIHSMDI